MQIKDTITKGEAQFDIIEVVKDKNGYCRLLRSLNSIEEETIELANEKQAETFTHMSTWVLVTDTMQMSQFSNLAAKGPLVMPVNLRLRVFGDEAELLTYNVMTIDSLMDQITERIGMERDMYKAKVLDENTIKRIDNKLKDKKNKTHWTTL